MVTILEDQNPTPYTQQAPIAGLGDVPANVSASASHCYSSGVEACNKGDYGAALDQFDRTLKLDRNFPHAWYNKGTCLGYLARYQEALDAFEQAINLQPDYSSAWHNKGVAFSRIGRYEDALEAFERNVLQNPDDAQAWLHQGSVLLTLRKPQEAYQSLKQALAYSNDQPLIWLNLGVALARMDKFAEAQDAFENAFQLKDNLHAGLNVLYKAWSSSTLVLGMKALLNHDINGFERAGLTFIDIFENAQNDDLGSVVDDALSQAKRESRKATQKGRKAFEELEVFIKLMKIKDPLEGWRALGKVISESWPKGLSAVQAIREQRR